ncbi:transglycosylase domain-containing protein [Bacillus alveayuensis]|jgi:penicillin-binding protein 1B|uniref:transglycosylase domain-containing protein n=1 Tax=Aeribacillus alveayuensis TaxID=279215 RepID=UPI0006961DE8|nr:transglycosylase domain-containing protein [Bacillus alveayuensis]
MENFQQWKRRFVEFYDKHVQKVRITYGVVWNLFLLFIVVCLIGISFAGGVGAGYFASLVKEEPIRSYEEMEKQIYDYSETTDVYFANNVYLGKLRSDIEREEVKLEDVSEHLIHAIIATEDEYFYEHNGIVPKAIMRALFQEFTNSSVRTGGSTLTQQLIKNQILTNEVSFDRKAKEILLAMRLEQFFTKDQILEAYLNVATFGRNSSGKNIAGVQAAAQGIFGVDAKDLTIPQAAFIAGLPQSPFGYTPFTNSGEVKENLEPGLNRMKTVLKRMLHAGFLSKQQYEEALKFDLRANLTDKKPSIIEQYPYLIFEVEKRARDILMKQFAEKDGYNEKDLANDEKLYHQYYQQAEQSLRYDGYVIHTTIDKEIYDRMQQVAKEYQYYGSSKPQKKKDPDTGELITVQEPVEVGAVLIENKTGKIISFVGGRDHNREQVNHATSAPRPNGSTMKPLLVYAPAMELGIVQPGTVIADVPYSIGGYSPKNYGGGYHGLTSVRDALKYSYNIPAVKTYAKSISHNPISYLEKMGFSTIDKRDYGALSLALGGMTIGVTVEENVNAYATFANGGEFVDAYLIEKIETKDGHTIYEHQPVKQKVFSPQTAYLTIDMMRDVIRSGTAASLKSYLTFNSDWAGKTGTGQDYRDAWFVASNPNVSFGTWIGYDTPKRLETKYKGLTYSKRNILLWAKLMNAAYEVRPQLIDPSETFKSPGGIVTRSYCAISGHLPSDLCKKAGLVATDIFNAKYAPTKVDDNLTYGKFVYVKDEAYQVPDSAPSEFVQEGPILKEEALKKLGIPSTSQLMKWLPKDSKLNHLVASSEKTIRDNGSAPSTVAGVKLSGNAITWKANADNDVIGYRIYRALNYSTNFQKVGSVPANQNLSFTVSPTASAYYVVAVDVAGKESNPSTILKVGEYEEKKLQEEKPTHDDNNDSGQNQNNEQTTIEPTTPNESKQNDRNDQESKQLSTN